MKRFEFSLFCLLFGNEQKLLKNCNFCFWAKAMFLLNPFSTEILWKIANKKQTRKSTLNGYISKTRVHSESKLKLSKSSFKVLQNTLFFARSTHLGTRQRALPLQPTVALPAAYGIQRVTDELGQDLNLLFCSLFFFFLEMSRNFQKTAIFTFGEKQCFYLTH